LSAFVVGPLKEFQESGPERLATPYIRNGGVGGRFSGFLIGRRLTPTNTDKNKVEDCCLDGLNLLGDKMKTEASNESR